MPPHAPPPDLGDAFLRAAEAAHEIASPQQFFVWLRLHLHRFVPHDLLLTRVQHDPCTGGRSAHVINCVVLPAGVASELSNPAARFWGALEDAWHAAGHEPCWLTLGSPAIAGLGAAQCLSAAGCARVLVHGQLNPSRRHEDVLLAFARVGAADHSRDGEIAHALALWMPYLHHALHRCDGGAGPRPTAGAVAEPGAARPLTARELQVLVAVREAKANAQIAVQLGISPLTVKNHLRSIQRKLGARNRAHAVAEAMSMRLIS